MNRSDIISFLRRNTSSATLGYLLLNSSEKLSMVVLIGGDVEANLCVSCMVDYENAFIVSLDIPQEYWALHYIDFDELFSRRPNAEEQQTGEHKGERERERARSPLYSLHFVFFRDVCQFVIVKRMVFEVTRVYALPTGGGTKPWKRIAIARKLKDLTISLRRAHLESLCDKRCIDAKFGLPDLGELTSFIKSSEFLCRPFSRHSEMFSQRSIDYGKWSRFKLRRFLLSGYRCALNHGYTTESFLKEFAGL